MAGLTKLVRTIVVVTSIAVAGIGRTVVQSECSPVATLTGYVAGDTGQT